MKKHFLITCKSSLKSLWKKKGFVVPNTKYAGEKYKAYCDFVRAKPFGGLNKYLKDNLNIDVKVEDIINKSEIEKINCAGGWTIETIIIHNLNDPNIAFVFDESDYAKTVIESAKKYKV